MLIPSHHIGLDLSHKLQNLSWFGGQSSVIDLSDFQSNSWANLRMNNLAFFVDAANFEKWSKITCWCESGR